MSLLLIASAAHAEITFTTAAPFDRGELASALEVRHAGARLELIVTAIPGGVRIATARGVRDVALDGLTGAAAARLVALAIDDLFLADLVVPSPRRAPLVLAAFGTAMAWDGTLGGLGLDLSVPVRDLRFAVEVAAIVAAETALDLDAALIRLTAATQRGAFELRAGLVASPIVVHDGVGDQTFLVGGTASARIRVGGAVIAVGVDGFATRTTYHERGETVMVTPRFAPWLAAGIEMAL